MLYGSYSAGFQTAPYGHLNMLLVNLIVCNHKNKFHIIIFCNRLVVVFICFIRLVLSKKKKKESHEAGDRRSPARFCSY